MKSATPVDPDLYITVFADASYCSDSKAYGWCFWLKHGAQGTNVIEQDGGFGLASSEDAELEALHAGLRYVQDKLVFKAKVVVVQSDCVGALRRLRPACDALKRAGAQAVVPKHVKGHQGGKEKRSWVNELCDTRAKQEMRKRRNQGPRFVASPLRPPRKPW